MRKLWIKTIIRRACLIIPFIFTVASIRQACANISITYNFDTPNIEIPKAFGRNYCRIELSSLPNIQQAGKPALPFKAVRILLPSNEEIADIKVIKAGKTFLGNNFTVEPGKLLFPLGRDTVPPPAVSGSRHGGDWRDVPTIFIIDSVVYNSIKAFPENPYKLVNFSYLGGYGIATIYLYPVEYIPKNNELYYYKELTLTITTKNSEFRIQNSEFKERVKTLVDNQTMLNQYGKMLTRPEQLRRVGNAKCKTLNAIVCDYLIITNHELAPYFEKLKEFKTQRGILTQIATVESIQASCAGADTQEKIRNFIKDMYANKGIKYVLLGGDDEIIPHRGLWDMVNEESDYVCIDYDIAADLYYGALNDTWNDDGDDKWGEPAEADLYAEVFVGRAALTSPNEVTNFINKTIAYQNNPRNVTSALMAGEDLDWTAWGSWYKEEIRKGATSWGDTTVGFPLWFNVDTLYDNPTYHWGTQDMLSALNQGYHFINHLGHADVSYAMKISNDNIPQLTNDSCYSIIYSQGCYCNSFDNREGDGSIYWDDAISEYLTRGKFGAVAFLGNTRYGWGDYSSTQGASQFYDRAFFDGLFGKTLSGEPVYKLGDLFQYSKEANIALLDQDAMRWCYYQLCILGDPELSFWTDVPKELTVNATESLYTDSSEYTIYVSSEGLAVESAFVCLSMDSTIYIRGYTDIEGKFICIPKPVNIGEMKITVTHHNHLPYYGSVAVIRSTPVVYFYKTEPQYIVPGDSTTLAVWVKNYSSADAKNVWERLTTNDSSVIIYTDSNNFGNIAGLDTAPASYGIYVKPNTPDGQEILFNLSCNDSLNEWQSQFSMPVHSPILIYETHIIEDTNKILEPGESGKILVFIKNIGSEKATTVRASLSSADSFIYLIDTTGEANFILPDFSCAFELFIGCYSSTPLHHFADVQLNVNANEIITSLPFKIHIGAKHFLIWDSAPKHNSGPVLKSALEKAGYTGDYTYSLLQYFPQLKEYTAVFVCFGILPNHNYIRTDEEEGALCNYIWSGGNLWIEGGNFWYNSPNYTLRGYCHTEGIAGGKADADTVLGVTGTFTQGLKTTYTGENRSMDRLKALQGAWVISRNSPTDYNNATAFTNGSYKTIALAYESKGLNEELDQLVDTVMKWFRQGGITHDVAIWQIENPGDSVEPGTRVNPVVTVKNIGKYVESFKVYCKVDSSLTTIYSDSALVTDLPPDSIDEITFEKWKVSSGDFNISFSHNLKDDESANNIRTIRTIAFAPTHLIHSATILSPPVIDGSIDSLEWAVATKIDISNVWGKRTNWKYPPGSAYALIMNDSQNLYLAINSYCDFNIDFYDGFLLWVDDNGDSAFPSSPDSSEGLYIFRHYLEDIMLYKPIIGDAYSISFPVKAGLTEGRVQYEMALPFGTSPEELSCAIGDTIRIQLLGGNFSPSLGINECFAFWPQDADSTGDPLQFVSIAFTPAGVETLDSLPTRIELFQNAPNPASGKIVIKYALPYSAKVELKIYNISGQLIKTLVNREERAGYKEVQWDGKNNSGKNVSGGIYFCILTIEDYESSRRACLSKKIVLTK